MKLFNKLFNKKNLVIDEPFFFRCKDFPHIARGANEFTCKHANHYEIREMYDAIDDGWAVDIEEKAVRSFDLTWSEIDAMGGPGAVKQMIADQYEGIDFW